MARGARSSAPSPTESRHGQQPEDGGQRGHEDGPQTEMTAAHDRLELGHPAPPELVDGVDEDDGVVDHDPDQHDRRR